MVETGGYETWKRRTVSMAGKDEGLSMHVACYRMGELKMTEADV